MKYCANIVCISVKCEVEYLQESGLKHSGNIFGSLNTSLYLQLHLLHKEANKTGKGLLYYY